MNQEIRCHNCMPVEAIAALLIRLDLGLVMFFFGLNKFLGEGGVLTTIERLAGQFKDSPIPGFLVLPFAAVIPFAEVVVGVLLVFGLMTRAVFLATGLLLVGLTAGMAVLQKPDVVAHNLVYMVLVVAGLWFAAKDNRYSLDRVFKLPY